MSNGNEPAYPPLVTVCDRCLRASCWHGEFFCEDAARAGTVQLPVATLCELNLLEGFEGEHPDYWHMDHTATKGLDAKDAARALLNALNKPRKPQ